MKTIKKLLTIGLAALLTFGMGAGCMFENPSSNSNLDSSSGEDNVNIYDVCAQCYEYIPANKAVYQVPEEKVVYRVSEDGTYAEVCGYEHDESAWREGKFIWLVIAEEYNGVPVTKIADNAFQRGDTFCCMINGVHLPNSITHIGDHAFDQSLSWGTLHLPANLTHIGAYAFKQTSLTSVKIPNSVTYIGDGAFRECDKLTTVEMGRGVTSLGNFVFGGCRNLTSITIPNGITAIGEQVFENCDKIEEIIIPDNVTSIGVSAFVACDNLQYVEIGDGVETIYNGAFDKCTNLTTLLLGEKVKIIEDNAFGYCDKLETIYYKGVQEEWEKEDFNTWDSPNYNEQFAKATVYFYSEDMPSESGNYWHYAKDGKPMKWSFAE